MVHPDLIRICSRCKDAVIFKPFNADPKCDKCGDTGREGEVYVKLSVLNERLETIGYKVEPYEGGFLFLSPGLLERVSQTLHFVLDYVERAGVFTGRGKLRKLLLSGALVNMATGEMTGHLTALQNDMVKILSGRAYYRK
jgi:hypothetical protein